MAAKRANVHTRGWTLKCDVPETNGKITIYNFCSSTKIPVSAENDILTVIYTKRKHIILFDANANSHAHRPSERNELEFLTYLFLLAETRVAAPNNNEQNIWFIVVGRTAATRINVLTCRDQCGWKALSECGECVVTRQIDPMIIHYLNSLIYAKRRLQTKNIKGNNAHKTIQLVISP